MKNRSIHVHGTEITLTTVDQQDEGAFGFSSALFANVTRGGPWPRQ